MTERQRQDLSELADGELGPGPTSRVLADIAQEPELRVVWERYHLIGQAMRGEHIEGRRRQVAERVRVRVASEPVDLATRRRGPRPGPQWGPMAGAALAAGLAFVAVFWVPAWLDVAAPRLMSAAAPGGAVTVVDGGHPRWHLDRPDIARKLDLFLVNHQEQAPASGAKGMLPYATFVAYETRR